jgi:hypothetical protein
MLHHAPSRPLLQDAVAQETAAFKQRMATNDADIQEEFAKLNDDKLLHLEEVAVKRVWDEVSAQFPVRTSWIESLSQMLYAIENDRQHVMRDTLAQVNSSDIYLTLRVMCLTLHVTYLTLRVIYLRLRFMDLTL